MDGSNDIYDALAWVRFEACCMCIGHDVSCSGSPREHCFSGRTAIFAGKGPQNFRACGGLEGALRARGNLKTPPYTITPVTLQVVVGVPGIQLTRPVPRPLSVIS